MAAEIKLKQGEQPEIQDQEDFEIDLVEMLYRLLEKARYIIIAALVGALIAGVITFQFITPTYTATSKLYVRNSKDSVVDLTSLQISSNIAADYLEVFNNWHVHQKVIDRLNLPYSLGQMQRMVSVSNKNATRILHITVTSTNNVEAQQMAETYAEVAQEFIAATMGTDMPSFFEHARTPLSPSAPNKARNIAIGFLIGAVLAAAIIIVQFIVDDRVRSADIIERKLGLSVLGMMPITTEEDGNESRNPNRSKRSKRKGGARA